MAAVVIRYLANLLASFALLCAAPSFAQSTYPTPAGSRVNGVVPLVCDANGANCVPAISAPAASIERTKPVDNAGRTGALATYIATANGYTAYATPTDMVAIFGSATKTVVVTRITVIANATATTLANFQFVRRSTANTGGTPTALTIISNDSTNPAATAAPVVYGAAPTTGSLVGVFYYVAVSVAATTAPGTAVSPFAVGGAAGTTPFGVSTSLTDFRQPIVLRGIGEGIVINFNGAALPAGFTASVLVEWEEY